MWCREVDWSGSINKAVLTLRKVQKKFLLFIVLVLAISQETNVKKMLKSKTFQFQLTKW